MTKAYLFDSLCGIVYRCMFAGVDGCGVGEHHSG